MLPDEQALPADTAIPARSNWTSWPALARPAARWRRSSAMRGRPRPDHHAAGRDDPSSSRARSAASRGIASSKAAPRAPPRSQRRPAFLRAAAIALLLPAARLERRQVLTSNAPTPGGPPSLCADTAMKSASGSGSLPALCAQSASSSDPAARTRGASRSSGWMTPGLVVDLLDRDQRRPSASTASSAASSIRPSRIDRNDSRARAHRARHDVMLGRADAPRPGTCARAAAISIASLAPLGEDDVMTPAERLGDRRARFLEQRRAPRAPRHAANSGLAQRLERARHRRARFGQHRRGRGMVEIDAVGAVKSADSCRLPVERAPLYRTPPPRRTRVAAPLCYASPLPCPK